MDYSEACEHFDEGLTRRTIANGTTQLVTQCIVCGKPSRALPKNDLIVRSFVGPIPAFDEGLRARYWDARSARADAIREQRRADRRAEYQGYLSSPQWHHKRHLRLQMDDGLCQARLSSCLARATEVHHLTYQHVGNEPLFDLVSLCAPCHREITRMDRGEDEEREVA